MQPPHEAQTAQTTAVSAAFSPLMMAPAQPLAVPSGLLEAPLPNAGLLKATRSSEFGSSREMPPPSARSPAAHETSGSANPSAAMSTDALRTTVAEKTCPDAYEVPGCA